MVIGVLGLVGKAGAAVATTHGGELKRQALLERLTQPDVRLFLLFASAGYGKSTLARQIGETLELPISVCDLSGARDVMAFVSRVLATIAPAENAAESALARFGEADSAVSYLLRHWSSDLHPYIVFENAEHLSDNTDALELLAMLLRSVPSMRRICICSRVRLHERTGFALHSIARPHELAVIEEQDLAFNDLEVAALTGRHGHMLDTLMLLTRGWPLCVRLVARLATLGRADALSRLHTVEFTVLYDYLIEHVIDALDEQQHQLLIALAAFAPREGDLERLFPDDPAIAIGRARASPFVQERDGELHLHPLVRESVLRRYRKWAHDMLVRAAELAVDDDPVRAALLFAESGDFESAAQSLRGQGLYFLNEPTNHAFAAVLARLPREVIVQHPALASVFAQYCGMMFSNEERLVFQRQAYERVLHLAADDPERLAVVMGMLNVHSNLGQNEEAWRYYNELANLTSSNAQYYRRLSGCFRVRTGDLTTAFEDYDAVCAFAPESHMAVAIATNEMRVKVHRALGDFSAEVRACDLAIRRARACASPIPLALTLFECAFGAWFRGDDVALTAAAAAVESERSPLTDPGMRLFRACLRGDLQNLAPDVARPQVHAYAYLIALSYCRGKQARAVAELAISAADRSGEPFLSCVSRVAHAFVHAPTARKTLLSATQHAARVGSEPLQAAVHAASRGDIHPFFSALHARVTGSDMRRDGYVLSHFRGTLHRGHERLRPSGREMEVLCYLGFSERPVECDELAEAIMPDATAEAAFPAIRVTISRIRKKYGHELIVSTDQGYELGPHVAVPLSDLRTRIRAAEARRTLDAAERAELQRDLSLLQGIEIAQAWEWANEYEAELDSLSQRITAMLSLIREAFGT